MRNHVIPQWGEMPMGRITHSAVQKWVTDLGDRLGHTMVSECHRLLSSVLRAAMRDQLIGTNPCEGVRLPKRRRVDSDVRVVARADLPGLLAEVPERYRALVAVSAGTGLRWGECLGLRLDAIDLDPPHPTLRVSRTLIEIGGHVSAKP